MSETLTQGQKAALAAKAGGSVADAAAHGVPHASVKRATAVMRQRPDLFARVETGEMSDSTAAKIMAEGKRKPAREAHPAAQLFPAMGDADRAALRASLEEHGYRAGEPPVLLDAEGRIIDGRNRVAVCDELGIEYPTETHRGEERDVLGLVISRNLARRHLTEGQRAAVAAELATLPKGRPWDKVNAQIQAFTQPEAAEALNVSRSSVQAAAKLRKEDPKTFDKVKKGEVSLGKATATAKPKDKPITREELERKIMSRSTETPMQVKVDTFIQHLSRIAELAEVNSAADVYAGFKPEKLKNIGLSVPDVIRFLTELWEIHNAVKNAADDTAAPLNIH